MGGIIILSKSILDYHNKFMHKILNESVLGFNNAIWHKCTLYEEVLDAIKKQTSIGILYIKVWYISAHIVTHLNKM